jgi:hypothetical protein
VVHFDGAYTYTSGGGYSYAVRLVRAGQPLGPLLNPARPDADYLARNDGTATHMATGLMWQRCAKGQSWAGGTCTGAAATYTWDQANALKDAFAGQSDWRLPTIAELESLVNFSAAGPSINGVVFPATEATAFWSSVPYVFNSGDAWYTDFSEGIVDTNSKSFNYQVRLVRTDATVVASRTLSVTKAGAGTLTSTPAGIACGTACSASFFNASSVTLTAKPDAGSTFTGWSGACTGSGICVVNMNAARSVTANFKTAPFTLATTGVSGGVITAPVATVTNKLTFNRADIGKTGAVYITGVAPSSFLSTQPTAVAAVKAKAATPMAGSTATSALVLIQLTSSGWKPVVNGQLIAYASGVLGDQLSAQTILTNTDTSTLAGAQFCVGYGTSAAEMSDAARMQLVATVPDPSATSASRQSCLVTDTLQVQTGWNLLGNSRSQSIQVSSLYSDAGWVNTVWKWDATQKRWQIYAPSMDASALQNLINDKGYGVLAEIKPGDGYWVQATAPASVMLPSGTSFNLSNANLVPGWNQVTTATSQSPAALSASLGSFNSLWAWDSASQAWYFYAPSLDTGTALADYARANGYLDFAATGKTLGSGVGFWLSRP